VVALGAAVVTLAEFYMAHAGHGVERTRLDAARVRYYCARCAFVVIRVERFVSVDSVHGASSEHLRKGVVPPRS
jgi:hypothetical protein